MNILMTLEKGETRNIHFPEDTVRKLQKIGNVKFNESDEPFKTDELMREIKDIDICLTHWGCPQFTKEVIDAAKKLKMIAHAAGSVANIASDIAYEKGIRISSSNSMLAKHVAEGTLAYMLAGLRLIPQHDMTMKKKLYERRLQEVRTLFNEKVGLVGLGTVGMYLLDLLKPFNVEIKLFDPYISKDKLKMYPEVEVCSLDEVLSWGNIISVHASLTPETRHMLSADKLKLMKDNSLLVNTARGAVIDEAALIKELQSGRITAVLDVYEKEPLLVDSPLRERNNVILSPHMAGSTCREQMTYAMIEEIERFINGKPLEYEISYGQYKLMTR